MSAGMSAPSSAVPTSAPTTSRVESVSKLSDRTQTMRFMHRATANKSASSSSQPRKTEQVEGTDIAPLSSLLMSAVTGDDMPPVTTKRVIVCISDNNSFVEQSGDNYAQATMSGGSVVAGRRSFGGGNKMVEAIASPHLASNEHRGIDVDEEEMRKAMGGGKKRPREEGGRGKGGGGGGKAKSVEERGRPGGGRYTKMLGRR